MAMQIFLADQTKYFTAMHSIQQYLVLFKETWDGLKFVKNFQGFEDHRTDL